MPNTVPAAGEAMPSPTTNRRRFLLGLAAASTAAAVTAVANAASGSGRMENQKLIALAAGLPVVAEAYHAAAKAYRDMDNKFKAATPFAPDEMTERGTGWPHEVKNQPGETELFAGGGYLRRPGEAFPRRIVITSWMINCEISGVRRVRRQAKKAGAIADYLAAEEELKALKKRYSTIESYQAEYRKVATERRAACDKLYPAVENSLNALVKHISTIMTEEDVTMEGLIIKAEALVEWNRVQGTDRMVGNLHNGDWHGKIAASILRHAEGGAANV